MYRFYSSRKLEAYLKASLKDVAGFTIMVPMRILYPGRNFIWVQALLVICIAWISTVTGQEGFLSIDCGSDQDYYDVATGIYWVTDTGYTSTGRNINNIKVSGGNGTPIPNKLQSQNMRYFDDLRSRDCYVLPVLSGETYLVRGTFFYGNLSDGVNPITFSISMDSNTVDYEGWNAGNFLLFQGMEQVRCPLRVVPAGTGSAIVIDGTHAEKLTSLNQFALSFGNLQTVPWHLAFIVPK
ncbi:unnamed protein product [Calypogeia fissa]